MIDVKEATGKAKEYLVSFFPDAEKVQLEEVELTSDKAHWYITLSYEGVSNSVASALLVGKSVRYKVFKLDTKSGDEILAIFEDLWKQGHTLVVITHNPYISERAQKVIHLIDGTIANDEKES